MSGTTGALGAARIAVTSRVVVRRADQVLLESRLDGDGRRFYRPIGGKVELAETSRAAAAREFHEETGMHAEELRYLACIEDIGPGPDGTRHEICFVYEGTVREAGIYAMESVAVREGERTYSACWRSLDDLAGLGAALRPGELAALLRVRA